MFDINAKAGKLLKKIQDVQPECGILVKKPNVPTNEAILQRETDDSNTLLPADTPDDSGDMPPAGDPSGNGQLMSGQLSKRNE